MLLKKDRKRNFLFSILIIGTLIIFFPREILIDFLFYKEEPVQSDVIVLLGGNQDRMKKAVELYHSGYAEYILLINAHDNAYYSKEIILNHGFDSAIVVTSNYHMRRSQLAFERVFDRTDIKLTYVPYQHDFITRDNWSDNGQLFTNEYIKLLGGYLLYSNLVSPDFHWVPGIQTILKIDGY